MNSNVNNVPNHWQVKKLGEVCEVIMGQSPPSTTYNSNGIGLPFFQGKAEFTELYPIVEKWCDAPNKIALPNDILLSVRAPVGTTNIANQKCCIGRGLAAIRYENYKFIFYFLRSIEQQLDKKGTGTTFRAISGETIRTTDLPLPPLPEQHAIVSKIEELFSELENGKQQLQTALQQLKVYRQSLLKAAFEGKLTNKNVKDGELPEGWIKKTLVQVCDMKAGFFVKASEISEVFQDGLYPCYGGNGLRGYVKSSTHEGMFPLVGRQGALCGNVHLVSGKFHATEHAVVSTPKDGVDTKWLYYKLIAMRLNQYSTGTAQPGLSVNKLLPIELAVPSHQEQQLIVDELESKLTVCDKIEETISQSLQQAETLRQSILKKAFEGKLVVG